MSLLASGIQTLSGNTLWVFEYFYKDVVGQVWNRPS